MHINNWDKWQSFRKDRGTPPWIKVHRNLLSNTEWVSLSDKEKGHLISIWILAADRNGEIPDDPSMIMRMAMLEQKPNINKFIELGFIAAPCQPLDSQVTKQSREEGEESRGEESRGDMPSKTNIAETVLTHLNETANRKYKPVSTNIDLIKARLDEGYELQDLIDVIDHKTKEWISDDKMFKFLRPSTLFGKDKFSQYSGETGSAPKEEIDDLSWAEEGATIHSINQEVITHG